MISKRKTFFFHPTLNNTNCRMDYNNDNDDSIYMNHFTINTPQKNILVIDLNFINLNQTNQIKWIN